MESSDCCHCEPGSPHSQVLLGQAAALGSFSSRLCVLGQGVISCSSGLAGGITRMGSFKALSERTWSCVLIVESEKHLLVALRSGFMENKSQGLFFLQLRVSMQWMHLQAGMLELLPHGLEHFLYLWNKVKAILQDVIGCSRQGARDRRNRLFSPALR